MIKPTYEVPGKLYANLQGCTILNRSAQHANIKAETADAFLHCKQPQLKKMNSLIWKELNHQFEQEINDMLIQYKKKLIKRLGKGSSEILKEKGRGSALIYAFTVNTGINLTSMNNKTKFRQSDLHNVRKLKAGIYSNLNTNKYMKIRNTVWNGMTHEHKSDALNCKCKHNGVQDPLHMIYECSATRDLIDDTLTRIASHMNVTENQKSKFKAMSQKDQITYTLSGMQKVGQKHKIPRVTQNEIVKAWSRAYNDINKILTTF